eukprot:TRINITY_DN6239_c0_g1_i11.p1 TRINITY_DN6239_c0_g1~~TRINITY_DN6239_c0_g1_i11.p1  ORF type:complete len:279 (-),score=19.95 TRINITY_DN6239_c0_g1_i11:134-970(-)
MTRQPSTLQTYGLQAGKSAGSRHCGGPLRVGRGSGVAAHRRQAATAALVQMRVERLSVAQRADSARQPVAGRRLPAEHAVAPSRAKSRRDQSAQALAFGSKMRRSTQVAASSKADINPPSQPPLRPDPPTQHVTSEEDPQQQLRLSQVVKQVKERIASDQAWKDWVVVILAGLCVTGLCFLAGVAKEVGHFSNKLDNKLDSLDTKISKVESKLDAIQNTLHRNDVVMSAVAGGFVVVICSSFYGGQNSQKPGSSGQHAAEQRCKHMMLLFTSIVCSCE